MALTCEIMIDLKFVVFENCGKYFPSYDKAFYNGRMFGRDKKVFYVFTPTMKKYSRVSELEKAYKDYFGCDYFNSDTNEFYSQLSLKGLLQ